MTLGEALATFNQTAAVLKSNEQTMFRDYAYDVHEKVKALVYDYPVKCTVCKTTFTWRNDVAHIATWEDVPRGVCGECVK